LEHIEAPDCSIETMFKRVRNTVAAASKGKQTSWEHTSLSGEFYFNLSLGNLIDEYDGTALADRLFVVDPSKKLCAALRSPCGIETAGARLPTGRERPIRFWWHVTPLKNLVHGLLRT
jgi:hypothetical protein